MAGINTKVNLEMQVVMQLDMVKFISVVKTILPV